MSESAFLAVVQQWFGGGRQLGTTRGGRYEHRRLAALTRRVRHDAHLTRPSSRVIFEPLEPRVLLSAAPIVAATELTPQDSTPVLIAAPLVSESLTGPDGLAEPNDTLALASPSGLDATTPIVLTGAIGDNPAVPAGLDVDLIRIGMLTAGDRITIDLDRPATGSALDSLLRLFNASGTQIAFSDDAAASGESSSLDSYIDYQVTTAGEYFVGVSGYNNRSYDPITGSGGQAGSTGAYTLILEIAAGPAPNETAEPNDTLALASPSGLDATTPIVLTGAIGDNPAVPAGLDVDLIRTGPLTVGDRITIDLDRPATGSALDSLLRLFNASGTQIAFSDDAAASGESSSLDSYIDYQVTTAGEYFVGVSGYNNRSYDPITGSGGQAGSTGAYTLTLTMAGGAPPVLDLDADDSAGQPGSNYATTWTEDLGPVLVADSDATISDPSSATLQSMTITLTNPLNGASEVLAANTAGTSITAAPYDSTTGLLMLSGSAPVAQYQQVLRTLTYNNISQAPTPTARTITVVATDGVVPSNQATTTVTMVAVNDPPVNQVPGPQSSEGAIPLVFSTGNSNQIAISDSDAGTNPVGVTLMATNGTITLSGIAGLSFSAGDGVNDQTMTFTGTITGINTALNGLRFASTSVFHRVMTLEITTDDQGQSGSGGAKSDTDQIAIVVKIVVTNQTDVVNGQITSISDLVLNSGGDGISLREAILAANNTPNGPSPDVIAFNIPGAAVHTIAPLSGLPTITDPVVINGYTQPGTHVNALETGDDASLLIELDGSSAGTNASGLVVTAGNSIIRGLVINRFQGSGVLLSGPKDGNLIEGNFIGTDPTGASAFGNQGGGITIDGSPDNRIGGAEASARNVVSGNQGDGVTVTGATTFLGDINPGGAGAFPSDITVFDNALYFSASDGVNGRELWRYDEASGTNVLVADINAGAESSDPSSLTVFNNALYFSADDGNTGRELWRYDGVTAIRVTNINANTNKIGGDSDPAELIVFNNVLYFRAVDGTRNDLWRFDGVTTRRAADNLGDTFPSELTVFNNVLYFSADDGNTGRELWRYDGAIASLVADIQPGRGGSFPRGDLTVFNNALYFTANDGITGEQLWRYDGAMATRVEPTYTGGRLLYAPRDLTAFNNALYFVGQFEVFFNGRELIGGFGLGRFDGTTVSQVPGIFTGNASASYPHLTVLNNALYFYAIDEAGTELWRYDGTTALRVADIFEGPTDSIISGLDVLHSSFYFSNDPFAIFNNSLYLSADDGRTGQELWRYREVGDNLIQGNYIGTNGAGTMALGNSGSGVVIRTSGTRLGGSQAGAGNVISGNSVNGVLISGGSGLNNDVQGNRVGVNAAGTAALGNLGAGISIAGGTGNLIGNDGILTSAGNVISGNGTDGVALLGGLTADNIVAGNRIGTNVDGTTALGNRGHGILVTGPTNTIGGLKTGTGNLISGNGASGITISDSLASSNHIQGNLIGTTADGTATIGNSGGGIVIDGASSMLIGSAFVNGAERVAARNVISGNQGDGVAIIGATTSIGDAMGGQGTSPSQLTVFRSVLYFSAFDDVHGRELWRYDEASGTNVLVADINAGAESSDPSSLTVFNNALYFSAEGSDGFGRELWRYDGVTASRVADIRAGSGSSAPSDLIGRFFTLYFFADDGNTGRELWRYDGVTASRVADIQAGSESSAPSDLIEFNNALYFSADDGNTGRELWRYDEQTASASRVADIRAGSGSSAPSDLTEFNFQLYFTADDGNTGQELWRYDGVTASRVADIQAGSGSSAPSDLIVADKLYFAADDGSTGRELWRSDGTTVNLVADINPGRGSSNPSDMVVYFDLFFRAEGNDGAGRELWQLDFGDKATRITDINPGSGDSGSGPLTVFNKGLYFSADNGVRGQELWRYRRTSNNFIEGNYIGTNEVGTAALGNSGSGVVIRTSGNDVGGTQQLDGNVISGNGANGVLLSGVSAFDNEIEGNFIGVNATGTAALGNVGVGVVIEDGARRNRIGDPFDNFGGAGNVISGNRTGGVTIDGSLTIGNVVQSNRIGTNAAGSTALGNDGSGVLLAAPANLIGGEAPRTGNLISGNGTNGIVISGTLAVGNQVQGNVIGANAAGTASLGNVTGGVLILGASGNLIGGTTAGARNLIAGNGGEGVVLAGTQAVGNLVQGNAIGTNAAGTAALGNSSHGVLITDSAENFVGGALEGAGNLIAFNGGGGIVLTGNTATENTLLANQIVRNADTRTRGIDLGGDGITANDPLDADGSPNHLQNFPELTGAFVGGLVVQDGVIAPVSAVVRGLLRSIPSTLTVPQRFTLEFFAQAGSTATPRLLGRAEVTTDLAGQAPFEFVFPTAVTIGDVVFATATDAKGNTSEFSAAILVTRLGTALIPLTVTVSGSGTGTVTSLPLGIALPGDGTELYPVGTPVTLTATAAPGSTFAGWSGQGINSTSPTLTLVVTSNAPTVTATFVPTGAGQSAPPEVATVDAIPFWYNGTTVTWQPVTVPADRELLGYHVRIGAEPGVYESPIFVPATQTSLTFTDLLPVEHFFTVSSLTHSTIGPLSAESIGSSASSLEIQGTALEPSATGLTAVADTYATRKGGDFRTVRGTGVLVNDTTIDGRRLRAELVDLPLATQGRLQFFNPEDGSFLFVPEPNFVGTATFSYRVTDGTTSSAPAQVRILIAQESGYAREATATPDVGLLNWTVVEDSRDNAPSIWSAVQNPTMSQFGLIGLAGDTSLLRPGTHLYLTNGLAEGRRDYTLTFQFESDATGALGLMFRRTDALNYYRFSLDQGAGYRRFIKVVEGVPEVLMEQSRVKPSDLAADRWELLDGPAYLTGSRYTLELGVQDTTLPGGGLAVDMSLMIRDPVLSVPVLNWIIRDADSPTNHPLTGVGLALYSAGNPGSFYNVAMQGMENPDRNLVGLDVRTEGLGLGTVTSTPGGISFPGSPAARFPKNSLITLTATAAPGSTFGGWTGLGISSLAPTLQVTLDTAKLITARFNGVPKPSVTLDLFGDQAVTAESVGKTIVRYLSGVRNEQLLPSGLSPASTELPNPADLRAYLDQARTTMLDVDADGVANPFTDGRLIYRFLLQREQNIADDVALMNGSVLGPNARRVTASEIRSFLSQYLPATPHLSSTEALRSEDVRPNGALSDISYQTSTPSGSALSAVPVTIPMGFSASFSVTAADLTEGSDDQPLTGLARPWLQDFVVASAVTTDDPNCDLSVVL